MVALEKTIGQHTNSDIRKISKAIFSSCLLKKEGREIYPMRKITAIVFSFFLVYAGAAEALIGCLSHEDHSDHHFEGHHSDSGISAAYDHSRNSAWPIIHCPTAEERLGPALHVASANLNRFDQITSVHASFLWEPASPASRNSLWQEALFKRILTFSLPNDLSRHLFLSVFQI
jgi:hypothetical protein